MTFVRATMALLALLAAGPSRASDAPCSKDEPQAAVPFSTAFKDYRILPTSISPDRKFAFIYPDRAHVYELQHVRLCLVTLKPFAALWEIPLHDQSLEANAHGYYTVNWSADSSAAVFIVGAKWGPAQVWLAELGNGKFRRRTNLAEVVRRQVLPDYRRSHASRYNDDYAYILEGDNAWTVSDDGLSTVQRGWDLDSAGHVIIDCVWTTDPKGMDPDRWTVRFKGTWDIVTSKFIEKTVTRVPKS